MSASSALQLAIGEALKSNPPLVALVDGRVFDIAPPGSQKPYVEFGPTSFYLKRQDGFRRRVETVQLDIWADGKEQRQPCKAVCDAVVDALDQAKLALDDPYALGRLELILARVIDDPDGITKHGILQFECEITGG